jgi:hypothetical protein
MLQQPSSSLPGFITTSRLPTYVCVAHDDHGSASPYLTFCPGSNWNIVTRLNASSLHRTTRLPEKHRYGIDPIQRSYNTREDLPPTAMCQLSVLAGFSLRDWFPSSSPDVSSPRFQRFCLPAACGGVRFHQPHGTQRDGYRCLSCKSLSAGISAPVLIVRE